MGVRDFREVPHRTWPSKHATSGNHGRQAGREHHGSIFCRPKQLERSAKDEHSWNRVFNCYCARNGFRSLFVQQPCTHLRKWLREYCMGFWDKHEMPHVIWASQDQQCETDGWRSVDKHFKYPFVSFSVVCGLELYVSQFFFLPCLQ